jgi:hypothetical protein
MNKIKTMKLRFKTNLNDVELVGLLDYLKLPSETELEIENNYSEIYFSLEVESKEWGIKSIYPCETHVSHTIEYINCENGNSGTIEIDSSHDGWQIDYDISFDSVGYIQLEKIEIDLIDKKITLSN